MQFSKKGFTFIELMVAGAAFSIIFASATAILFLSIKNQKYNLVHQRLINEANYAVEYMARAIRMAQYDRDNVCGNGLSNYHVGEDDRSVEFVNYQGECEAFYWGGNNQIMVMNQSKFASDVPLISDDFEIIDLIFAKKGDSAGDNKQPLVTITMELREKKLPQKPHILIQTTISQRNLDI